ncbi:MAG: hypothetical protein V4457_12615 [Pseudomonadota bacterium]
MSDGSVGFIIGWPLGCALGFLLGTWAKGRYWRTFPTHGERLPLVVAALLLLATAAQAQQPDPAKDFADQWQGMLLQTRNAAERAAALVDKFQAMRAELDYWRRWCGDKPGCAK